MVVKIQEFISPTLASRLQQFSEANNVMISKDLIKSAISYIREHTNLSQHEIDNVIILAVKSIKPNDNYEGSQEMDPTTFGKELILVCTENGIKIRRVPRSVEVEVKDNFAGIDEEFLDNSFVVLNMQPDLTPEDRGTVFIESLKDTLNNKDSFDGDVNYEIFGENIGRRLSSLRDVKRREASVDKLMDIFTGQDNYTGGMHDAFVYFDQLHDLEDDDFAEYFEPLDEVSNSNFEDSHDYLFKKLRKKIKNDITKIKKINKGIKAKVKAIPSKLKAKGPLIKNLLTGGVSGMSAKIKKAIQAKKAQKEAKKQAQMAMDAAAAAAIASQQKTVINPAVVSTGTVLQQESVVAPTLPQPETPQGQQGNSGGGSGGGGSSGGSGDENQESGEGPQEEMPEEEDSQPEGEESEETQEQPEASQEQAIEGVVVDGEEQADMGDTEEQQKEVYDRERLEQESNPDQGQEEDESEEVESFFGFNRIKKKQQQEKGVLSEIFGTDNFMGEPSSRNVKIFVIILVVAIGIFIYYKTKK